MPLHSPQKYLYDIINCCEFVLVHGYDSLDPYTVWNVVETKIVVLLQQARELL